MEDRTLVCTDCGSDFPFTVAEQEFFKEKGFTNEPKRCQACRRARKQQRGSRPGRPGGGPGLPRGGSPRGGPPRGHGGPGGHDSRHRSDQHTVRVRRVRGAADSPAARSRPPAQPRVMHRATCSICGDDTEVPFKPDGVRPVYCLPCLKRTTR